MMTRVTRLPHKPSTIMNNTSPNNVYVRTETFWLSSLEFELGTSKDISIVVLSFNDEIVLLRTLSVIVIVVLVRDCSYSPLQVVPCCTRCWYSWFQSVWLLWLSESVWLVEIFMAVIKGHLKQRISKNAISQFSSGHDD